MKRGGAGKGNWGVEGADAEEAADAVPETEEPVNEGTDAHAADGDAAEAEPEPEVFPLALSYCMLHV